jgi:cell filamentation protein
VSADPYVDARTRVLRNRLGITNAQELAAAEARMAAAAERVLFAERLVLGTFDLDHLRALHRHLFGEVYDWAGELRTVNMTKGGTLFALAEWVEPQTRQLLDRLRADGQLRDLNRGDFVTAAGRLLSDLNALHPFREGNGRVQRVFLQLLANAAGWQLEWASVDRSENDALSIAAMADRDAFAPLIDRILHPAIA